MKQSVIILFCCITFAARAQAQTAIPALQNWWQVFRDPQLDSLEQQALRNNQQVKAAVTRIDIARAAVQQMQSQRYPQADAFLLYQNAGLAAHRPLPVKGAQGTNFTVDTYNVGVNLQYELDVLGRIRNTIALSRQEVMLSAADQRVLQWMITTDVASYYFRIQWLLKDRELIDSVIDRRQRYLDLVNDRYKAGIIGIMDVRRAAAELEISKTERSSKQTEIINLTGALQQLVTAPVNIAPNPAPAVQWIPDAASLDVDQRPDVQRDSTQVALQRQRYNLFRYEFLPRFTLGGNAGVISSQSGYLFDVEESRTWTAFFSVRVPLFDGYYRRSTRKMLSLQARESEQLLGQRKYNAATEIGQLNNVYHQLTEQTLQFRQAIHAAAAAYEVADELYRKGLTTYFEVLDADRSLLQLQLSLNQTMNQQAQAAIALMKASGYGM